MLPDEVMRKVRLIEITMRKVVDDVMTGQYRSHFKGHGIQFSEHRLYVPGDDVRHIDWKTTARSRDPVVKKYDEERELQVLLIVDVSGSKAFGSQAKLKSEVTAELGGLLAFAASHTGDKVGVMMFADRIEHLLPPKKGRQHVLRIVRDLLSWNTGARGTDLKSALESAGRVMKHAGIIFILSDFLAEGYEVALKRLSRRHEVVAIRIADPRESSLPKEGQFLLTDPETGENRWVDVAGYSFRKWFEDQLVTHQTDTDTAMKSGRVEYLEVTTAGDYANALVRFFRARGRRRR